MDNKKDSSEFNKLWAVHDTCTPEYEECLIGNKEGLEKLRYSIDEALKSGESKIDDEGIDFIAVKLVENDPRFDKSYKKGGIRDSFRLLGCGLIGFIIIMIIMAGLFQIWNWIK